MMKQLSILLVASILLALVATLVSSAQQPGKCQPVRSNPCDTVRCGYGAQCQVQDGRARCVCQQYCTKEFRPVCGTDGKTYSNACELRARSCRDQSGVQEQFKGACEEGSEFDVADN